MSDSLPSKLRITSIVLLILIGLNAIAAGYGFIEDPSGDVVGIPISYIRHTPFENYLVPGILLFICIGLLSLLTGFASIQRWRGYPLFVAFQGVMLTGWIIVQVILVQDFNMLHFICLVIGIILFFCGLTLKKVSEN